MATITLDVKQIAPFMAKVIDEFQMATVIALTRCAKAGQKAGRDRMAEVFTLRNKYTQNQVRMKPATKRDPTAVVFIAPGAEYLVLHETGGTKQARRGNLAVPTDAAWPNRQRVLAPGRRPRALAKSGKRKPFLITADSGARLIARRKTKKRYPLEILYVHARSAAVRASMDFTNAVLNDVRGRFSEEFKRVYREKLERLKR
jgi:hypothetical protein